MHERLGHATARHPIDVIRKRAGRIAGLDLRRLPRRWRRIGDVLILVFPADLSPWKDALAPIYAEVLGARTVVEDLAWVHGAWRVPEVRWLWGGGTETVLREDGVRFRLDVRQVMFSAGNVSERIRMGRISRPGETVVDLFAGIGYFSLPIALHSKPERVVACEANPVAFHYLEDNIAGNRAGAVEARFGDCRAVAPDGVADRVVMGHFDADRYLDVAFRAARHRVTIHFHALLRGPDHRTGTVSDLLRREGQRAGFSLSDAQVRIVKSYRPHVRHVVADATFVWAETKDICSR